MLRYVIYVLLFTVVQLSSCKSNVHTNLRNSNKTLEIDNLLNENYSGFEQEEYRLIRNEQELHSFYGVINRTRKPGIAPPKIDFNEHMILIWCGDKNTSNFAELKITENDENILVHKLNNKQGLQQNKLIVHPFSVYKLRLSPKSLKILR